MSNAGPLTAGGNGTGKAKTLACLGFRVLFSVPRVNICSVAIDCMHSKYLGSDQTQYGKVFYLLCFHTMAGSPLQNLGQLWEDLKGLYKSLDTKHQYTFLNKLSMFVRKSGLPKLGGSAAEIKGLALPVLMVF